MASTGDSLRQAQASRPHDIEKPREAQQQSEIEHRPPSPPITDPPDPKTLQYSQSPGPDGATSSYLFDKLNPGQKLKRERLSEVGSSQAPSSKRPRANTNGHGPAVGINDNCHLEDRRALHQTRQTSSTRDIIAHWACTSCWPKDLWLRGFGMEEESPSKKRKTETTHRSSVLKELAQHGISMNNSKSIDKDSKELCRTLLKGERTKIKTSLFSPEQFARVLDRARDTNEPRVVRDVTSWIVPSAEVLWFLNELKLDYIGDGLSVEWTRCTTMGSKIPKPDYVAAILRQAYTQEEVDKLEIYSTPERLFWFTPELSFPFLICEAKSAAVGLNEADLQNIHSASIAVRAIFALYKEAFGRAAPHRVYELYRKILVFSVSHNHDQVSFYGHFVVAESGSVYFRRYFIAQFSLTSQEGKYLYEPYNFVQNIYEQFAPAHLKRIKDAVAHLPTPAQRTSFTFAMSNASLEEAGLAGQGQMSPPSIPDTAEREKLETERKQRELLETERAKTLVLEEQIAQMNIQLNSFIQSNLQPNSENNSEVVTMLQQQIAMMQEQNAKMQEQNAEMKEQMDRQRQQLEEQKATEQARDGRAQGST